MDLKKMSMSELIAHHNVLAVAKGASPVQEFKNLAAARAAVTTLEQKMTEEVQAGLAEAQVEGAVPNHATNEGTPLGDAGMVSAGTAADMVLATGIVPADSKYSTVGKRGPNQGIGEFAKQLLTAGMPTADVLKKVHEQFPTAKTSASCIAYYKAALKNPNLGKRKGAADPAALRAKAAELMAAATAAEQAAVELAKKQAATAAANAAAAQVAVDAVNAQAAIQAAAAVAQATAATEAAAAAEAEAAAALAAQPQA